MKKAFYKKVFARLLKKKNFLNKKKPKHKFFFKIKKKTPEERKEIYSRLKEKKEIICEHQNKKFQSDKEFVTYNKLNFFQQYNYSFKNIYQNKSTNLIFDSLTDLYMFNLSLVSPFYICFLILNNLPFFFKRHKKLFYTNFIRSFLFGFLEKSPIIINTVIEKFLQSGRKHFRILNLVHYLLKTFTKLQFIKNVTGLRGIHIVIKGKFNGKARKRMYQLKCGETISFQDTRDPIYYYYSQVITYTGVFGIKTFLYYKAPKFNVEKL